MLLGRLGLETARLPHADRHGLLLLDRGALTVESGCLHFASAGGGAVERGDYTIPHQSISLLLLGPGSTVSHDALRLYARRLVGMVPQRDDGVLRGIEGARVKALYANLAQRFGIRWQGRRYDRNAPLSTDLPNQAINHAASAVEGAAAIAVTATATIPQLGFIHEDSGQSFVLDVADLFRDAVTVPCAFRAVTIVAKRPQDSIERITRRLTGETLRRQGVIAAMIDRIKALFSEPPAGDEPRPRARKAVAGDQTALEADIRRSDGDADDGGGDP